MSRPNLVQNSVYWYSIVHIRMNGMIQIVRSTQGFKIHGSSRVVHLNWYSYRFYPSSASSPLTFQPLQVLPITSYCHTAYTGTPSAYMGMAILVHHKCLVTFSLSELRNATSSPFGHSSLPHHPTALPSALLFTERQMNEL